MHIIKDNSVAEKIKNNLGKKYAKGRPDVHVSDLVLCMRQALYRKLQPLPPTNIEIGFFLDGSRRHSILQSIYGQGIIERKVELEGVKGSIDIDDEGIPIEFKSTRSNLGAKQVSDHWVRQLIYYMLAIDSAKGILQVQLINARNEGQNNFPSYQFTFQNAKEKETWRQEFHERAERFKTALSVKDPSLLPIEKGEGEWICRFCKYRVDCDRIELNK